VVDSLIKRLDDDRYAVKITARKPTSKWSNLKRKRRAELKAADLLREAGLAVAPTNNTYAAKPFIPDLPGYIKKLGLKQENPNSGRFADQAIPNFPSTSFSATHRRFEPQVSSRHLKLISFSSGVAQAALQCLP